MPPRISLLKTCGSLIWYPAPAAPAAPFLSPFLLQLRQQRAASVLSSLSDNPGAYNKRIRRGRGPSSGKGKTSGRGHKGQKQHGKVPAGFNGGQTPIEVVHGKRGFDNQFSVEMSPLNVDRLQSWIDQGRINPSKPITMKELNDSRCLHGVKDGVKLLARGADQMRTPVNIIVSRASATAIAAIEGAGGTVTTRYYTPFSIRRVLRGFTDPGTVTTRYYKPFTVRKLAWPFTDTDASPQPVVSGETVPSQDTIQPQNRFAFRLPDPTSRKDIEYYRDPTHRGYLSHLVQEGEGPSLFFRKPRSGKAKQRVSAKGNKSSAKAENRIW